MGAHHFISQAIIPLLAYWVIAWFFYAVIYAGLHSAAAGLRGTMSYKVSARLDGILAGLTAMVSLLMPAVILARRGPEFNITFPIIIAVVQVGVDFKRIREGTLDDSNLLGDAIGYALALVVIGFTIALF